MKTYVYYGTIALVFFAALGALLYVASKQDSSGNLYENELEDNLDEYAKILQQFDDEYAFDRDPNMSQLERDMRKAPTIEGLEKLLQEDLSETKRLRYFEKYCNALSEGGEIDKLRELLEKERAKNVEGSRAVAKLERWVENAEGKKRYSAMLGKPIKLEGICLDDSELDWASYRGKVVIVDVWATWNGQDFAVDDYNSIRANYDRYHSRGLEVVGYNLDKDVDAIKKMKEGNPWKIVSEQASVQTLDENGEPKYVSFFDYYGLRSVPTTLLIDRDGNVLATNVAARELTAKLKEMFGEKE